MAMRYIDGFCAAVPTAGRDAYLAHATTFAALFRAHGALEVVEGWGDDVPEGEITSFPMAVKREEGETVVFSWIKWPSKAVRDAAWEKLRDEPLMQPQAFGGILDGKRMIYGGFAALLEA